MDNFIYYSNEKGNNVTINENTAIFEYPCSSIIDCAPYKVSLYPGKYKIELYGAQGGDGRFTNKESLRQDSGGKGAYVSGIINFRTQTNFYLFLGAKGEDQTSINGGAYGLGGYNGGGDGGADTYDSTKPESAAGGGGSTDIRFINAQNVSGWKSRIIVAAGGGGAVSRDSYNGSAGGELEGITKSSYTIAGSQTSGIFGKGGKGVSVGNVNSITGGSTGGSGGGYYGGYTKPESELPIGTYWIYDGGSGGSSFISGYPGCNSVKFDKSETVTHTGKRNHFSGFTFKNGVMMSGLKEFNKPGSNEKEKGHSGNGAAVITYIGKPFICATKNLCRTSPFGIYIYVVAL